MTIRSSLVAVGLAGLVASACLFGENAFGQPRAKEVLTSQKDAKLDVIYYGVSSCNNKGCHGGDKPTTWIKDDDGKQLDLITQSNEAATFEKEDKHGEAYNVLKDKLGQRMQENLKDTPRARAIAEKTKKPYAVTSDPDCLACHAVVVANDTVRKNSEKIGYKIEDGVGCAACHGPHPEWVAAHALMVTAVKFRPLTAKQKEEQYGLYDLRNPIRRTELCASCHVGSMGNKEKNEPRKFVTHEMYAAGHPPLPGFEVATFSDQEPQHWQLLRDKTPALQKELGLRKGEQEETLLMLLGGVIAFRDTMILLREQAREAEKNEDLLDLSNFDCYSCHHPIEGDKKKNWRQTVDWTKGKKLGKVRVRDWSMQLIRLSAAYLDVKEDKKGSMEGEVKKGIDELNKAFEAGVGGDLKGIVTAADKLEKLSRDMSGRINKQYPTKDDLPTILSMIPQLFKEELLGYDSAREVAWAAEVVFNELHDRKKKDEVKTIDAALKLRLPRKGEGSIASQLNKNMEAVEKYDPREFKKLLEKWPLR